MLCDEKLNMIFFRFFAAIINQFCEFSVFFFCELIWTPNLSEGELKGTQIFSDKISKTKNIRFSRAFGAFWEKLYFFQN